MSTILNALRRLEEDSSPGRASPGDARPTLDRRAADELRDRIVAEESVAQAGVAENGDSNRTKLSMMLAAAALLILGLGVGAYTMSTRIDSDPTASVAAATPSPRSMPIVEDPRAEEAVVNVVSLQATSDRAVISPTSVAPALSNLAIPGQQSPTETLAGNALSEIPSEEMPPDSQTGGQLSRASVPLPMAAQSPTTSTSTTTAIATSTSSIPSSKPSVVSGSTTIEPTARSAATKSVVRPSPAPPKVADEMARAAVTPTPAVIAARSGRAAATPETSLAETPAEPSTPRRRPKSTSAAQSPPSVSAPVATARPRSVAKAKLAESQPLPESRPSPVKRIDRRGLPDLSILRTSWHPDADRRSAKIRLEATHETLTLREGDAIGGLVIQKISPSAVLFKVGEVEIRRRVGQPGRGD